MKTLRFVSLLALGSMVAGCVGDPEDTSLDDTQTTDDTDVTDDTAEDTGEEPDPYVFASNGAGDYTRVDRAGMPAVSTVLITSKDDYNAANPSDDLTFAFAGEIIGSLDVLHGALDDDLAALGLTPCTVVGDATGTCVQQGAPLIVPDTIQIDTNNPAGFPNGRALADPVIDITLAVILLDLSVHPVDLFAGLPVNPPSNDVAFKSEFPYLADAH